MTRKEALKILNLPDHADRAQIRHAYSELSKSCHVETHPEEFNRLHEAYKTALAQAGKFNFIPDTDTAVSPETSHKTSHNAAITHGKEASLHEPSSIDGTPYDEILDMLVHGKFAVSQCLEITQLIYHKYRYDEMSMAGTGTFGSIITKRGIVWKDAPADERLFFGIPWNVWKTLEWTAFICHPEFLKRQYDPAFLGEFSYLLQEENLSSPDGISRNLYLSLCIAYGFFYNDTKTRDSCPQEIEYILCTHRKCQEYIFDLLHQPSLQEARDITLFCQKALSLSDEKDIWDFLNTVEEKLLESKDALWWKQFIFRNMADLSGSLFSKVSTDFLALREAQQKCAEAYIDTVLSCSENREYQPLSCLLRQFRQQYLDCDNWREIVCRPAFLSTIGRYLLSQKNTQSTDKGNGYPVVRFIPYEAWRQLRNWANWTSPFWPGAITWLKSNYYFSEYEKRYQKEHFWKATRVKEYFFSETFPLSMPDRGKRKLLHIVRKGTEVDAAMIHNAFLRPILTNEKIRIPFLTRLANTMAHFRFLQYTPTGNLPGGIFCFLKKEVILYQQKDNLTCHLSHEAFYDIISIYFDRIVYDWDLSQNGQKFYSEEFLDTACRNLYCYGCFVHSDVS